MKRFVFSLQKILDLREFEQKQAEAELGKANAEIARIQQSLDAVAEKRAQLTHSTQGSTDSIVYLQTSRHFTFLDMRKDELMNEMAEAEMVAEEKRAVVREAMKKVKVMEKLKESKFAEWKKEYQKQEEISSDDIVTSHFS